MWDKLKAKNILKNQVELLEKPNADLFGRAFRDHVKKTAKFKTECKGIYRRDCTEQNNDLLVKAPHFQN